MVRLREEQKGGGRDEQDWIIHLSMRAGMAAPILSLYLGVSRTPRTVAEGRARSLSLQPRVQADTRVSLKSRMGSISVEERFSFVFGELESTGQVCGVP